MKAPNLLYLASIVFLAVTCIVLGDTAGKIMTSQGVDPFIVAFSRVAIALIAFLPFSGMTRQEFQKLLDMRLILRTAFIVAGITSILTALKTEPIANVFGAFFIGPIVSYILAIVILGERPTKGRTSLLALGFAGVMLVVKPGFGETSGIGFALLAGVFYGAYLVMTKRVAGDFRPRFLLMSQLIIGTLMLIPFAATAQLPTFTPTITWLILGSALGSGVGNYLLVIANRMAPASLIAPLIYSQLISATLIGVIIFGDWPDLVAFLGLVIIAASGFGSLAAYRPRA